jgi:hypothetical protein
VWAGRQLLGYDLVRQGVGCCETAEEAGRDAGVAPVGQDVPVQLSGNGQSGGGLASAWWAVEQQVRQLRGDRQDNGQRSTTRADGGAKEDLAYVRRFESFLQCVDYFLLMRNLIYAFRPTADGSQAAVST